LNFWVLGEGYVIIFVASIPLMNPLVKWARSRTQGSYYYGTSAYGSGQDTKQTWTTSGEERLNGEELNSWGGFNRTRSL
jgi:hypothetical protein